MTREDKVNLLASIKSMTANAERAKAGLHTPAPWFLDMSNGEGYICSEGNDKRMEPICGVFDLNEADAQLMVAAPDLLKALHDVKDHLMAGRVDRQAALLIVQTAIAKAGRHDPAAAGFDSYTINTTKDPNAEPRSTKKGSK
jgi:hypothetical protein